MSKVFLGPDNNPGRARWCEEHTRLECTKRRNKGRGDTCHCIAIKGTDKCRNHSGVAARVAKIQGEARITAWTPHGEADKPISSSMAVLGVLQMSWLRLAAYSELLRRQVAVEGDLPERSEDDGEMEATGLIGHRYGAAGKDGVIYRQSEEVRALVVLEAAERDRVVKYAKTAHDMGISDKLIGLAERWGDMVAGQISMLLDALDLTTEQAVRVPSLLHQYLGSIDMNALGVGQEKKQDPAA
jgi:hypothetical protein